MIDNITNHVKLRAQEGSENVEICSETTTWTDSASRDVSFQSVPNIDAVSLLMWQNIK